MDGIDASIHRPSDTARTVTTVTVNPMVKASEIFNRPPAPAPWPSTDAVVEIAVRMLPLIADDEIGKLVEELAVSLADRLDELKAIRALLSESLALAHVQCVEIRRLKSRLAELLSSHQVRPQGQGKDQGEGHGQGQGQEQRQYKLLIGRTTSRTNHWTTTTAKPMASPGTTTRQRQ